MTNRIAEYLQGRKLPAKWDPNQQYRLEGPGHHVSCQYGAIFVWQKRKPAVRTKAASLLMNSVEDKRRDAQQDAIIANLSRLVATLTGKVEFLTSGVGKKQEPAFGDALEEIVKLSAELFPGEIGVESACDPEFPGDTYLVFKVVASGETADIMERELAWRKRVAKVTAESSWRIRLYVRRMQ